MTGRRPKSPNSALALLLGEHGMSHKGLAFRVNQLAEQAGRLTAYKHTSVARWLEGATPRDPVPKFIAAALSERIGRLVTVEEIGMGGSADDAPRGWDFPRDRAEAIEGACVHWSGPDDARPSGGFAVSGYALPVTRWLGVPADATGWAEAGAHDRRVGQEDLKELRDAAAQARLWDAEFGGGNWRLSSVTQCLRERAVPLLAGTHSEETGRELFTIAAELSRVVAWAAFDSGHSAAAQQHFIQALRLARAGGDVETGTYILSTMALHTLLEGAPDQALDMAQGAFHRGRRHASRRVLAFAKLAEARALARMGDATGASSALSRADSWLDKIQPGDHDPEWVSYVTHGRLAADATEIFRDLNNPKAALGWSRHATDLSDSLHTRAVGLRLAVVSTAACQARDLDHALDCGTRSLNLLSRVASVRAGTYLRGIVAALAPWAGDPRIRDFTERLEDQITPAAPEAVAR